MRFRNYSVREEISVDEFLSKRDSLLMSRVSKKDFLSYEKDGVSNSTKIYDEYTEREKNDASIKRKWIDADLDIIKENTIIHVPLSELQEELAVTQGSNVFVDQNKDNKAYIVEKRKQLLQDSRYVRLESVTKGGRYSDVQIIEQNCQVWVYVKSIDKLLDISPFITSLSTSKSDIGNFEISLNPIEIEVNRDTGEISGVFISKNDRREFLNQFEILIDNSRVNQSFFDRYCQQNDAVFIRFEKLKIEEGNEPSKFGFNNIEVEKSSIPYQHWDMMGLVDEVTSIVSPENNDYTVNISGRDFMKILVEDGSYLLDLVYARGAENMFYYLGDEKDKYFMRNYVSNGAFEYLFKNYYDSLETFMGFIVNQLSCIGWTGENDLFDYYPIGDRPQKYRLGISNEEEYLENIEQNGVWKVCKIKVDPILQDRRVIDSSFIDTDGTLYEQFKKVCQDPFVDFWGDTFSNEFNFIARQQPFDRKGMQDILATEGYILDIETRDVMQMQLGWETEFYSWFQFYPVNELFGNDQFLYSATFPIIYLDKYIEHFGNHRKVVNDNYLSGKAVDTGQGKENYEEIVKALFNDLKYVIESYSVLPFTRRGMVVINGDRRIKRGDFVRLKSTGEIGYVDAVANNVSFSGGVVNRSTTLSLKRLMVERNLNENWVSVEEGQYKGATVREPYYYDVIGAEVIITDLLNIYKGDLDRNRNTGSRTQSKVDFGVNEDAFNFFLERRQKDII